ncbi:biotin synthase [Helicobacter cetorum]|uniref:biotin synthase n=1 Tax=Helicobacter cetorum TaxID=138563 RepID=UPI002277F89A|nr:biotin synthase [Helicobacter cetorum]
MLSFYLCYNQSLILRKTIMQEIFLCSISNVRSGDCKEDCAYCTQSSHHQGKIKRYKFKDEKVVLEEARALRELGALGFCLVTSGRELDDEKCEYIAKLAHAINKEELGLHLIACCGRADLDKLEYLRDSGIHSYNHNLETSQNFFPKICSTHTWEERFITCENTLRAGLGLCSGGIFGLGESWEDRMDMLRSLQTLGPHTTPINFFIKNPVLPIETETLSASEALECVIMAKEFLPNARLMVAGGREVVFKGDEEAKLFEYGINAVVLGDYLTTKGLAPKRDIEKLLSYGLKMATSCH